jgi:superfamily II DNA or RNA helicase
MKLRHWQVDSVDIALNHYASGKRHFLCLATPGAGKTVMAAEVAARLFEQDKIDFVLCFAPSITVSEGITYTFSNRFKARFDGVIGAVGCAYTYQNILFFKEDFWQLLQQNRVLVVFDEIHHCAGSSLENANAWGEEIIANVQSQAEYTLALTGTPWRSDKAPIVLSNYVGDDAKIEFHYSYGLKQAVRDRVCRSPKLVLIDNDKMSVTDEEKQHKIFGSFKALLEESMVSYQSVIINHEVMRHILQKGCDKLTKIRYMNPQAGGLVVASSVEHACQIIRMLREDLNQSAVLVTYKQVKPSGIIAQFRHSSTQWIVSVGMVSEGTDIPRLQVCCHLSRVKTELYFRQVLGRILRVNDATNQEAWLYTFAEPKLTEFAHRIDQDLPDEAVIINDTIHNDYIENNTMKQSDYKRQSILSDLHFDWEENASDVLTNIRASDSSDNHAYTDILNHSFEILGKYREQVIASFDAHI